MYDRRPEVFREDTTPGRQVEAKIKWFNASKGFGFVTMSDGSQDAFLPMAILRRAGYEDVREGASITCEVSAGAKGPLVTNVLNIDNSTAVAPGNGLDRRPPQRVLPADHHEKRSDGLARHDPDLSAVLRILRFCLWPGVSSRPQGGGAGRQ